MGPLLVERSVIIWPVHSLQTQLSPLCCAIISWVLLPLCKGKICLDFHWSVPESMLLKIWDTFYLRAKACILCFDMVLLIGVVGRRVEQDGKGVWWGECWPLSILSLSVSLSLLQSLCISLLRSQPLPVSGNTGILNGFPVLQLRPHPPTPTPPPCSAISRSHPLPALFSLEPPLHCALFPLPLINT